MARKNDPLTRLLALAVVFVGIPYALLSIIGSSLRDILGFGPPAKELLSSENAFIGVIAILVILAIVILIGCIRWCVRRRSRRCVTPSQLPDYGQVALPGNPPRDLPDSTTNDCPVVGGTFAREADLEKFLVGSWSRLDFGVPLDFVGQQVSCGDLGIIDLLARDRVTHDYVVIELKKGRADDVVFGQLSRYLGAVEQDRAKVEGVGIHGIIVARRISPRLRAAVSVNAKVSVRRYVWVSNGESRAHLAQRLNCSPGELLLLPGTGGQSVCACGRENAPHARYCAKCGSRVRGSDDDPVRATKPPQVEGAAPVAPPSMSARRTDLVATAPGLDTARVNVLLDQMARLDGGYGVSRHLARDLSKSAGRWVRLSTVHWLSKWCHPQRWAEREQRMQPVAEEVSRQLFGSVVGREV